MTIEIQIVCTDRGRHRRVWLGRMYAESADRMPYVWDRPSTNPWRRSAMVFEKYQKTGREAQEGWPTPEDLTRLLTMRCPQCRRNPQMTPELAARMWRGLVEAEVTELDIASLPF